MLKSWKTWGVVAASGLLIVASWLVGRLTSADAVADGLMIIAALVAGHRIAVSAVQALRIRMISIDLLVVVAAVGAMFIDNYWESAAVTFLFALGKALEKATLNRTRRALSDLVDSAPETATILRDGEPETVEVWELEPGDLVLVRNGEQVPVDGRVLSGNGGVDEATITGESVPAEKSEGSEVFAGTWLRSGVLRIEAVGIGADTTLARIVHRVEDAQDDKARTQTFMERFSTWYTPAVMISALVVALIPWQHRARAHPPGDRLPRRPGDLDPRVDRRGYRPLRQGRCSHQGRRVPRECGPGRRGRRRQDRHPHQRSAGPDRRGRARRRLFA